MHTDIKSTEEEKYHFEGLKESMKYWKDTKDYRKGDSCFEHLKMRFLQTMRKGKTT